MRLGAMLRLSLRAALVATMVACTTDGAHAAGRAVSICVNVYGATCVGLSTGEVFMGGVNGPWASTGTVFVGGLAPGDELAGAALSDAGTTVAVSRFGNVAGRELSGWVSLGNVFGGASSDRVASITVGYNGPIAVVTDAGDVFVRIGATTWQRLSTVVGAPTAVKSTTFGQLKNSFR